MSPRLASLRARLADWSEYVISPSAPFTDLAGYGLQAAAFVAAAAAPRAPALAMGLFASGVFLVLRADRVDRLNDAQPQPARPEDHRITDERFRDLRTVRELLPDNMPADWSAPWLEGEAWHVDVGASTIELRVAPKDVFLVVRNMDGSPLSLERAREILAPLRLATEPEDATDLVRQRAEALGTPLRPEKDLPVRYFLTPLPPPKEERTVPECPFEPGSFMIPEPVAFPREDFVEALAEHEALVRKHLPGLMFLVRREMEDDENDSDQDPIDYASVGLDAFSFLPQQCAVISMPRGSPASDVGLEDPWTSAHRFQNYFGIRRKIAEAPPPYELCVIVVTDTLISIRNVTVRSTRLGGGAVTRELEPTSADVTFEPRRQTKIREGNEWIVKWRTSRDAPLRESRTPVPTAVSSPAEYLDRLFARHKEALRADLSAHPRATWRDAFLLVMCNRRAGESVLAQPLSRREDSVPFMSGLLTDFPKSRALLTKPPPVGWLPVFVNRVQFAGIRWLAEDPEAEGAEPPEGVTEVTPSGGEVVAWPGREG